MLDPTSHYDENKWRKLLIRGLDKEYNAYMLAIFGSAQQSTLAESENILVNQEALTQMRDLTIFPQEEETLFYVSKKKKKK